MNSLYQEIDIRQLKNLFPQEVVSGVGEDFFIADFGYEEELGIFRYPCRFNGYLAVICLKGSFTLDINLDTFRVKENSLAISTPGNIIKVSDIDFDSGNPDDFKFFLVATSSEFMTSIRLDFNRLFNESMSILENPCIQLSGDVLKLTRKYMDMVSDLLNAEITSKRDIIGPLLSSVLYMLGDAWSERINDAQKQSNAPSARSKIVLDQFLKLVTEFHNVERNVAFYAEKLCLTPKYLSKFIKNVSGRSAPEWIDSFVILEAKNLLKYSDISIKQIVYKLNFSNQSVFYKFFKSQTGMTPSEYRNSSY